MTPQEWKEVEKSLKSFYDFVKLNCDGYEVDLTLVRISQFKNAIKIYVNGKIKGKWLSEDCEERRRFMRPVKKSIVSPKQKASWKKLSKKSRLELEAETTYTYFIPYWSSYGALKRHLVKNNNTIKMLREQPITAAEG